MPITKCVLLTGSHGKLGKAIRLSLAFDDLLSPTHSQLDINNEKQISDFFSTHNIDIVIHCAAYARLEACEKNPAMALQTNLIGTAHLVSEVLRQQQARQKLIRFIYISTDGVYECNRGNYSEKDATLPYSIYGWTKLGGEMAVRLLVRHCIIRTSFFDPESIPFESAPKDVYSSKLTINDLVDAISFLSDHPFNGVVNVGSPKNSDYERYKYFKTNLKPCTRKDIAKHVTFNFPYDSSLNCNLWKTILQLK